LRGFLVSNEELIARLKNLSFHTSSRELSEMVRLATVALEAQSAPHCSNCDYMEGIEEGMKMRPAPLVADSREALANALGVALANAYDDDSVVTVEECVADTLLASGVVSLAADRDRAEDPYCRAEDCQYLNWTSGSIPTHKRGSTCPNPYRESEGK
jgi:hypothetical protein